MPRQIKTRRVEAFPVSSCFVPVDSNVPEAKPIVLKIEEVEAMRLKDLEALSQEDCAVKMAVSRQTFQNILDSARKKTVLALTQGLSIQIDGGNYTTPMCRFSCLSCGEEYDIRSSKDRQLCPRCGSTRVMCRKKAAFCKNRCGGADR